MNNDYVNSSKNNSTPKMYGVWIPGHGWWKLPVYPDKDLRAYVDTDREVVKRYADWVGSGARVEVIDRTLELGEGELLQREARNAKKKWYQFWR